MSIFKITVYDSFFKAEFTEEFTNANIEDAEERALQFFKSKLGADDNEIEIKVVVKLKD